MDLMCQSKNTPERVDMQLYIVVFGCRGTTSSMDAPSSFDVHNFFRHIQVQVHQSGGVRHHLQHFINCAIQMTTQSFQYSL